MKELLEIGLVLGGCSLVVLSIASFWIPKALGWKEKLASLTPLMRELFWTYSFYVWSSHVFFAILTLGFGSWLMGGTSAAIVMNGFMVFWWSVRLYLQFFGFDLSEIEASRFNRIAKHLLTLLFTGLVVLFAGLICWNLGWLKLDGIQ